jgi:hypothetical protein
MVNNAFDLPLIHMHVGDRWGVSGNVNARTDANSYQEATMRVAEVITIGTIFVCVGGGAGTRLNLIWPRNARPASMTTTLSPTDKDILRR